MSTPSSTPIPDKYAHLLPAGDGAAKPRYVRTITPRLRVLLYVVFTLFGVLAANGVYLASVTYLQWLRGEVYEDHFYQLMFLLHLLLGVLLIAPVIVFGVLHMLKARKRRNKRAVRMGYALFTIAIVLLVSGVLLMRVGSFKIVDPEVRRIVYWAHIVAPLLAVWMYWLHRLAGPRIKWAIGAKLGGAVAVGVIAMVAVQIADPKISDAVAPQQGDKYFEPSLSRTATGTFINAKTLMNDEYCLKCHEDIYDSWLHSAHHLSSFNNPAYLMSVRETREVALQRDGNVQATRWCAGCHDPVPFFSGAFDDPNFDDINHPTAHAGITCTVCHAIEKVNSTRGNGDYVIDEPEHYPFAYSDNPVLQKLNELLVKAKPSFHKAEMLKPFHKSEDFCSTCHKVSLPGELTKYREWMRGQNHHDSYLLSGVSGHGARSFYYPAVAEENCNGCHMPEIASNDLGAKFSESLGSLAVKDHLFVGANTAIQYWSGDDVSVERTAQFLQESMRVDLFGLREGGTIDGELIAPLRPELPKLQPGKAYLLETVVRTLKLGHHFTQGTTDSNNIWLEVTVRSGDRLIGASGLQDGDGTVDPWSHFLNNFVVDRDGNRINRRNAQDIFTALYKHQIPPGAGHTVHYRFRVPEAVTEPLEFQVRLLYRKFDTEYLRIIEEKQRPGDATLRGSDPPRNPLPIVVMAEDRLVLPVAGGEPLPPAEANATVDFPLWQRWNDYGIGLLLKGKSELKQAAEAFGEVERLGRYDGPLNLARVLVEEGDLDGATAALERSAQCDPLPPPWTYAWLSGVVDRQQGNLQDAADKLRGVLETKVPERKFDFSQDYVVRNEYGLTLFDLAQQANVMGDAAQYRAFLEAAEGEFHSVLDVDVENVTAHANLARIYRALGDTERSEHHHRLHQKYKPDDNAAEIALPKARQKYAAADHAAQALVIYDLQRDLPEQEEQ
jgi:tetratricopeptide (TPR) repeat protein